MYLYVFSILNDFLNLASARLATHSLQGPLYRARRVEPYFRLIRSIVANPSHLL